MAKIIKVENGIVFIGQDNGEVKEVSRTSLNFQPNIGDDVEIFGSDDNPIIILSNPSANNAIPTTIVNQVYNQSNKRPVNKVSYCLLIFFLGGIGVHKFYEGKTGMGILYLLFCWTFIPAIVACIELIIALCKSADEQGNIYL